MSLSGLVKFPKALLSSFRRPSRKTYDPLLTSSGSDDGEEDIKLPRRSISPTGSDIVTPVPKVFYFTLFIVFCTLLNVLTLRIVEYRTIHPPEEGPLARPNQYVGLDKIHRDPPSPDRSIINFPFAIGLVDQAKPNSVISERKDINSLEARKVKIAKSTSTVIQFRTIDWGMESCDLNIRLPEPDFLSTLPPNSSLSSVSLFLGSGLNDVDIYRLETADGAIINPNKITFSSRPKLGEKIGIVHMDYGTEWHYRFPCAMDSLHAFAMVPSGSSEFTHVEWWQDKQSIEPAVFITQYATI